MHDEWLAQMAEIAGALDALVKSPGAEVHYDLLSDALWWADELPAHVEAESVWSLRPILRYRTTLILGQADSGFVPHWQAAQRLFPRWPGFTPDRCTPNRELAAIYRKKCDAGMFSFYLADVACRLKEEFDGIVPWDTIQRRGEKRNPADVTIGEIHDLICRALGLAGRSTPDDSWQRVRRCVAESCSVEIERVTKDAWLVRDLNTR